MIQFTCMYCRAGMSEPEERVGQPSRCPACGRTMRVPTESKAGSPPAGAVRERVEEEDIPLADEHSWVKRREAPGASPSAGRGRIVPPEDGGEIELSEVPLAEEPRKKKGPAAPAEEPATVTAGGLVVTTSGDVTGVAFQSERILEAVEIEKIGDELCALVDEAGRRRFFLDFGNVKFLSSQMIGVLLKVQKKVTAKGGRLLMCAVSPELQKVFQIVKLEKILPIVPDRNVAQGVLSLP